MPSIDFDECIHVIVDESKKFETPGLRFCNAGTSYREVESTPVLDAFCDT